MDSTFNLSGGGELKNIGREGNVKKEVFLMIREKATNR